MLFRLCKIIYARKDTDLSSSINSTVYVQKLVSEFSMYVHLLPTTSLPITTAQLNILEK